jgi:hypothetical protein
MADDAKQLKDDLEELRQLGQKLGQSVNFENLKNDAKAVEALLKAWRKEFAEINREFSDLSSTFKNVVTDLGKANITSSNINRSFKALGGIADKLKYDSEGISKLNKKDLENLQKKSQISVSELAAQNEILKTKYDGQNLARIERNAQERGLKNTLTEIAQYRELQGVFDKNNELKSDENNYINKLNRLLAERLQKEKEITKNLGIMGAVYKGISSTLQKMGVDSDIIKEMGDDLEKAAGKGKVGFKDLFTITTKGFKTAMEDPMARFTIGLKLAQSGINDFKKAFEAFKEFNNIIIGTARSLGLSGDQIRSFSATAVASQTQFNDKFNQNVYSTAQLTKSLQEVNEQLGLSVNIGQENNNEFTKMTQTMGLSADEATKIYKLGTLNNMSLKDTNKAISAGIVAAQKSTGVQINAKQVFQEIGKLSAGITAKFQQNPEAIAKAVAQAKALGTSLETIDKVGESLLNFESSIENQLKAQLLTGKQLNLEQARYAALTGDQATLMNEISSQVGSLADFTHMNVIAQKSLAEAFGMSKDELADMLQKQETFNKLGDVSGKSAAEQLKIAKERGLTESDSLVVNLQQQAAAEKLDATFSNIKMALGDILSGPLGGLVNMMASLSKHTGVVYALLTAMAGISLGKLILGIASMASSLVTAGVSAATVTSALTFGLGAIAVGAAIAGIIGAATSANDSLQSRVNKGAAFAEGGIVTGKITNATVGEAGPEAIIPLNSPKASSMMGGAGLLPMISALNDAVTSLMNRQQPTPQFALHVDGKQLGTVVGQQMETGTAQNIYTGYRMA